MNKSELQAIQGGMIFLPFKNVLTKAVSMVYKVVKMILG